MGNVTSNGTKNTTLPPGSKSLFDEEVDEILHDAIPTSDVINSRLESCLCRLNEMKKEEIACDFVIKGRSKSFPVHKILIAAASEYFYNEFSNHRRVAKEGVLVLADADNEAITQCIEFMYTGKATLKPLNAGKVFPVATLLQLTIITQNCENVQESGKDIVIEVENYAENMFSKVKKMRSNGFLCDFSLMVENVSIPLHNAVLTAWSGYFEAVFKSNLKQKSAKLNSFDASAVEICIDAAYTGSLPQEVFQTPDDFVAVMKILEEFQFKEMIGDCYETIIKRLSAENSLQVWLLCGVCLCRRTEEFDIKKEVTKYLHQNFERVIKSVQFVKLEKIQFLRLLQEYITTSDENHYARFPSCSPSTYVTSEVKVCCDVSLAFQAVKRWIEYDISREKYIFESIEVLAPEKLPTRDLFIILYDALIQKFYSSRMRLLSIILSRSKGEWMELISKENCFELKKITGAMSKDLATAVDLFILENLGQLSDLKEWKEMSAETVSDLYKVANDDCAHNMSMWLGLIAWAKQDEKRKSNFRSLTDLINFDKMSTEFIQTAVMTEMVIEEFPAFKGMISDILSQRSTDKPRIRIIHPSIKKIQQNYE